MKIGVLALQGDVAAHRLHLERCGAAVIEVKEPPDLDEVDGVVLPGGESTTMNRLLVTSGLREPLAERLEAGLPAFGTCAGAILLARKLAGAREDQWCFGAVDVAVRRNAYGRQIESFEVDLDVPLLGDEPLRAVFIRAPVIEEVWGSAEILATHEKRPVLVRQGAVLVSTFHPELTDDLRVHELFVHRVETGGW